MLAFWAVNLSRYKPLVLDGLGLGDGSRVRRADARAVTSSLFEWLSNDSCDSYSGENGIDELHLV